MIAEKNEKVTNKAVKDKLLITIPHTLKTPTRSVMYIPKGLYYKAIGIVFSDYYLDTIYIKDFKHYWDSIINAITHNRKQLYCSVPVTFNIKSIFLDLLPDTVITISDVIAINSKVYELLFHLKNITNKKSLTLSSFEKHQIESLKKYLENNIGENKCKLSLELLSKKFSINRNKMQQAFKQMYGETIFAYHRKINLEHAVLMLKEHDFNIDTIASIHGYNSVRSFRSAFQKQYGVLPSELRKHPN